MGLVVGGTRGVRIINGDCYGTGVYTATNPYTSLSYGYLSKALIVCMGLVPIDDEADDFVYRYGDFIIFRHSYDVFPMWYVQFGGTMMIEKPLKIDIDLFIQLSLKEFNEDAVRNCNSESLTEYENKKVNQALIHLTHPVGGCIKKSALKGQPRHITELLARTEVERKGNQSQ